MVTEMAMVAEMVMVTGTTMVQGLEITLTTAIWSAGIVERVDTDEPSAPTITSTDLMMPSQIQREEQEPLQKIPSLLVMKVSILTLHQKIRGPSERVA
jgi:hypothetical protein